MYFANTTIEIDNKLVAKITSYSRGVETGEENTSGSENYNIESYALKDLFSSLTVGETLDLEGIAIEVTSIGQSDLKDAASMGQSVNLIIINDYGTGYIFDGFFTSYEENGSTSEVYKFKGSFRINSKSDVNFLQDSDENFLQDSDGNFLIV